MIQIIRNKKARAEGAIACRGSLEIIVTTMTIRERRQEQLPLDDDDKEWGRKDALNRQGTTTSIWQRCLNNVHTRLAQNPGITLLVTVLSIGTIYGMVRAYYALEHWLDDSFWEAKLIKPFNYVLIRYIESRPRGKPKQFVMRRNNTFVINLDTDVQRFRNFQRINNAVVSATTNTTDNISAKSASSEYYQRFPGFQWIPSSQRGQQGTRSAQKVRAGVRSKGKKPPVPQDGSHDELALQQQEEVMKIYPFLRKSVQRGEFGNAGCTYSHIQLLERLEGLPPDEYYFIFEDDAGLSPQFIKQGAIEAPSDTDIVTLVPTSTKTVRVPYKYGENGYAIRVMASYGAFAYVITTRGASKLLRHLRGRNDDPIDVAMYRAYRMRMYHPTDGWPQAMHGSHKSTRHAANNG